MSPVLLAGEIVGDLCNVNVDDDDKCWEMQAVLTIEEAIGDDTARSIGGARGHIRVAIRLTI